MIIVIGDIMLDEYVCGVATRLAPEAPVPVLLRSRNNDTVRLGGAANVAASVASLGEEVALLGPWGGGGDKLPSLLEKAGITDLTVGDSRPATIKTRFVDTEGRQLLRVDSEDTGPWEIDSDTIRDCLNTCNPSVVVFPDYAKGCWTTDVWSAAADYCARESVRLVVDVKRDIRAYDGAAVIKCNQREWDAHGPAGGEWHDGPAVVVTRGRGGIRYHGGTLGDGTWHDIDTEDHPVYDVSGAGDIITAVIGVGLAKGLPMDDILQSAAHAASVSVTRPRTCVALPGDVGFLFQLQDGGRPK